ncbi:hypothetical protein [Roseovarius sp.]
MAKTATPPPDKGKPKPQNPTKSTPNSPRVTSTTRVFNDFAAI